MTPALAGTSAFGGAATAADLVAVESACGSGSVTSACTTSSGVEELTVPKPSVDPVTCGTGPVTSSCSRARAWDRSASGGVGCFATLVHFLSLAHEMWIAAETVVRVGDGSRTSNVRDRSLDES